MSKLSELERDVAEIRREIRAPMPMGAYSYAMLLMAGVIAASTASIAVIVSISSPIVVKSLDSIYSLLNEPFYGYDEGAGAEETSP